MDGFMSDGEWVADCFPSSPSRSASADWDYVYSMPGSPLPSSGDEVVSLQDGRVHDWLFLGAATQANLLLQDDYFSSKATNSESQSAYVGIEEKPSEHPYDVCYSKMPDIICNHEHRSDIYMGDPPIREVFSDGILPGLDSSHYFSQGTEKQGSCGLTLELPFLEPPMFQSSTVCPQTTDLVHSPESMALPDDVLHQELTSTNMNPSTLNNDGPVLVSPEEPGGLVSSEGDSLLASTDIQVNFTKPEQTLIPHRNTVNLNESDNTQDELNTDLVCLEETKIVLSYAVANPHVYTYPSLHPTCTLHDSLDPCNCPTSEKSNVQSKDVDKLSDRSHVLVHRLEAAPFGFAFGDANTSVCTASKRSKGFIFGSWLQGLQHANALWSFALGAATVGLLILGKGWQHLQTQNQNLRMQLLAKDQKITQLMFQLIQARDLMSKTRRMPVIWAKSAVRIPQDRLY